MERNNIYRRIFLLLGIFLLGLNASAQFAITSVNTDNVSCRVGYGQISVYTENRTGDVFFGLYNKPPFPPTAGLEAYGEYTIDQDTFAFNEIAAGDYYVVAVDLNTSDVEGQWITLSDVQDQVLTADAITVISGPTCYGWNDAILGASASGGNPPYTYTWNPGGVSGQQYTTASAPGIYNVTVNDSYGCDSSTYSDNVESFVYPLSHPSVPGQLNGGTIAATDPAVCDGDNPGIINSTVAASGGTETFNYTWESSTTGAAPWSPLAGTATTYDPGVLAQTTYFRRVATDPTCGTVYSNTVSITVNPRPSIYNVGGGGSYCSGGTGVSISLSGSESGVDYELYLGGAPTGTSLAGTGSALTFTNVTTAGIYTIVATNSSTGCTQTMNSNATVSIDPLPVVYNVGGGGSYCAGGAGVTITLSDSESGVNYELLLGGAPTGNIIAGTGSAISFTNITTAGNYTVEATNTTTACTNLMTGNATVSIDPLPIAYNVGGGGSYCAGGAGVTITLSDSESGVNYELYLGGAPTGNIIAGTGSPLSFTNITTAGNYTIEAQNPSTGCTNSMSGSVSVSIDPLPVAYNVGGGGSYCAGGAGVTITLSDSESGVNYELLLGGAPTGNILAGTGSAISYTNITAAGNYTIEATNTTTACTNFMTGSATVSIDPLPIAYNVGGGGSYCAGGVGVSITLSDSESGVNYELILGGAPTGNVIAGTGGAISFTNITTAGIYTIEATNTTTACTNLMSGSATVSIDPLPTAYSVTGGGSGCADAGVVVGLDDSESGVNYELYLGGAPTGNVVAGTGSAISFGNQFVDGNYTVVGTNATTSCTNNMSGSVNVSIDPLPNTYNVGGGGSYCTGGAGVSITLSGSQSATRYYLYLNGNPTGTSLSGNGGPLSFDNITAAGTYTILAERNGTGCQQTMAGSAVVSIDPLPIAYNVSGGGNYCAGGTGVNITLSDTESGVNYELYLGGAPTGNIIAGTGNAISFPNITTAGNYTIVATNTSTGCQNTMSGSATVAIDPLPTAYNVGGGGSYCAGGTGVSITLSDSESGVNYELYLGGAPTGNVVAGTGSAISFNNITTAGTYTIEATTTASGCQNSMIGNATVSIDPLPTAYNVGGGGSYCAGGTGVSITLSDSESGVNYELYLSGAPTGNIVAGTGSAISFNNITAAGNYTVVATNTSTGCQNNMNGNATISIDPLPTAYNVTGGGAGCAGTGAEVGLQDSESGVNYELYLAGAPTGNIVAGTGNAISFGFQLVAGNYTVVATNTSTGCQNNMSGSVLVTINPLPIAYNVGGGGSYCAGGTGVGITLSDSESGVNYELYLGGAPTGNIVAGTGSAISFTNITTAGNYTIVATNTSTGCTNNMTGSATVSIDPLPTAYNVGGGGSYCAGGTGVNITLSDSESGVNYELYLGGAPTGNIVAGTGNAISFPNITTAGNYTIVATNTSTGCQNTMSGSATVAIDPLPTVYNVGGGGSYCAGGTGVDITLSDSESGVNYELYLGGAPTGTTLAGTGGALTFSNLTTAGNYTIVATNTTTGCQNNMAGSATVSIDPLPIAYNVGGGGSYCIGGAGVDITLSGSESGVNYELYLAGAPTGNIIAGTGSALTFAGITTAGTYTIEAVNTSTGCQNSMSGSVLVDINPLPAVTASSNSPVCEGTSLSLSGGPVGMTIYSWNGPDGYTSSEQSPEVSSLATIAMSGVYTLTVTDGNGCVNSTTTTVIVNDNPVVSIPDPGNACTDQDLLITALVAGGTGTYDTYAWTGSGAVYLTPDDANPTVFNSPTDGNYDLTLTVTDNGGCIGSASRTISVIGAPTAYAGPDTTLCYGSDYQILDADTTNSGSLQWITLGDGSFAPNNTIDPVYTPGPNDIANGSVKIVLRASSASGCGNVTDTALITLPEPIQPLVGAPAPFLIGPNTEIEVCVSTTGHQFIEDMGFYLRTPAGEYFTLKRGLLETNFFFPPCFNFLGGGDTDNLCFTTELTLTDTLDLCTAPLPVTGTYAATGDWSELYNLNPAEGGWAVAINDTADFGTGGVDGFITNATISFIDTATATSLLTSVDYSSGAISQAIRDDRMNEILIQRDLQVSCPGECDAVALVSTTGGVPPYNTYVWDPAPVSGSGDNVVLCAGDYEVTVYDAIGCSGTTTVTVLEPPRINIDDINMSDTLGCNGGSDGFISVKASGGTGSLRFTLLPDITSEAADSGYFTGLTIGTYTIRIEDAKGCYTDTTVSIYEPDPLVLESAMVTDSVFCTGDNNGRILATASGGTEPYVFILEPVGTTNSSGEFTSLAPGSYVVKLTDANDCDTLVSDTLILGVPEPLVIDTVMVDSIVCNGGNGTFTVVVSGGTPPYNILVDGIVEVSGVSDTAYITRPAGNYDISVEDARLCTESWPTINLVDPPVFTLVSLDLTPVTGCYTNPNGEIQVNVAGGVPPYEYSLDGVTYQSSNVFTGLTGGTYTVYYRDDLGCVQTEVTTMPSPPQLLGNPVVTDVDGDNLGSIELFPSGGVPFPPPNEYLISFEGGPLEAITLFEDLTAGSYDVHIEDSEGCAWDSTIVVSVIDLDVLVVAFDADCYDDPSGEIRIWINDTTPPYDIYLNGELQYDDITENFRTLPSIYPGTYFVRVEDYTSRRFDTTVTIGSPPPIDIEKQRTNLSCHELNLDGSVPSNGAISYESSGGAGGFTYTWGDTELQDSARSNLTRGTYVVTIQDRNECTIVDSTTIIGQDTLSPQIMIYPEDHASNMTDIELLAYPSSSDQTLCYMSNWHLIAQYNNTLAGARHSWIQDTLLDYPDERNEIDVTTTINQPKYFRLEVTSDRCMAYDSIYLYMHDTIGMQISTDGYQVRDSIFSPQDIPLELSGTEGFQEYLWDGFDPFEDETAQSTSMMPTSAQIVVVRGTTEDGCYERDTAYIVLQQTITTIELFTPNDDGYNDTWVIPNAIQYPDLEVLIFNRWGQQVFYSQPYGIDSYHIFDGRSQKNGRDLPIGSYYYIIKPNDGETEPLTGTVTIVR